MGDKRKSDTQERTFFRTNRLFQFEGKWYFSTREGTTEGPFDDMLLAKQRMQTYCEVQASGMLGEVEYEIIE